MKTSRYSTVERARSYTDKDSIEAYPKNIREMYESILKDCPGYKKSYALQDAKEIVECQEQDYLIR